MHAALVPNSARCKNSPILFYHPGNVCIYTIVSRQDLMRQSTDLSEDQVQKSVGGVGDFLRMEENDESPAARDTVGHSLRCWALKLLPL